MHVCTVVVACKEKEGVVIYLGVRKQEACKSSSNYPDVYLYAYLACNEREGVVNHISA
jgi:hypothetical protein